MCLMAITACKNEKAVPDGSGTVQRDSLQKIIDRKDSEIDGMMGTLNDIQEGFRLINEAENRVNVAQSGEGTDKQQQLKENIKFISKRMAENRELISKLRQQLRESSVKGEQLNKTIEGFIAQMEEKDRQLSKLREELDAKDIHISELDEAIANLNTDVSSLKTESEQKSQTISTQDKQLNTAWYVFGTKKELKDQNILSKGEVLRSNFNKNYFTKIDIRVDKEIKLYSKSARLLTTHPSGSYTLAPDATGQYVLRISNPQIFWSTSKYLVVQVK